jgi:hypothetical protein
MACAGKALERIEYHEVTFELEATRVVVWFCSECGWSEIEVDELESV